MGMNMKARYITLAALAALAACIVLSGCEREQFGENRRREVRFTARTELFRSTKTVYSGNTTTVGLASVERINWENDDVIRILSDKAQTEGNSPYADYAITLTENKNQYSYAQAAPSGSEHGLQWESGTNAFFSVFPVPSDPDAFTVSGGSGLFEATLPADQSYTTPRTSATENYYGDMDSYAFMTAATTGSEGSDITLSFTPIVTTFYVTVTNNTGAAMKLQRVALSSGANALTGTWRTSFTTANARTYAFSEGGSWVGTLTRTDSNSTIYADFGGMTLGAGDNITVALFAIPKDITQLTLSVTSDETGTISLPLKYENSWLSFTGGLKYNLNNLGVPPVSFELEVDKNLLTYDYLGTATSAQAFTVTSTKTIGSNVRAASWKTQIKNSSDEWVDLDGNCPAWLDDFPLNSTGITTESQTYKEDVDAQPVVSHEDRLKSNKVYTSDGSVYDNSEKANALDLSKYNFINRRQESMRTSANTYIVAAPGWYKIPMLYGNIIEDNTTVGLACKGSRWAAGHLDYFKKATDANIYLGINYPWLQEAFLDHCRIHWEKYTHWNGSSAETSGRMWSSGSDVGVVTGVELNNDEEYMYFYVDPDMIRPGNVLLATYGSNGDCCWSWQIWITDQTMSLITVGTNEVLPVNLGWIDDTEGQYYPGRSAVLKFVSTEMAGLESQEMTVTQPEFERVSTSGWQTYYQWGRKDPMTAGVTSPYNDDGALNKSIKHPANIMYDESTSSGDKYYDWTSANYNNLWDSQNNSWSSPTSDLPNHKTVYDPSPRGFSVPPDAAWDGFSDYGYESFDNGLFFYTSSARTSTIYFPASGFIDFTNASLTNGGSDGYYWTIRPGSNAQRRASYSLRFSRSGSGTISVVPKDYDATSPFTTMAFRACAYSVRPVKYNVSATDSDVITGATTLEISFADKESDWGWTSDQNLKSGVTKTVGDVSIYVKGNNTLSSNDPEYIAGEHSIVLGNNNELTVSVPSGQQVISVTLVLTEKDGELILDIPSYADLSATSSPNNGGGFKDGKGRKSQNAQWDIESYSNNVFTPSANAVKFKTAGSGGDRRISQIIVTYK